MEPSKKTVDHENYLKERKHSGDKLVTADPHVDRRGFRKTAVLTSEEPLKEHVGKTHTHKANADKELESVRDPGT